MTRKNRNDLNAEQGDVLNCLTVLAQLLDFGGMIREPLSDSFVGPIEGGAGFDCQQAMCHLAENMCRRYGCQVAIFNPLQQSLTCRPRRRVGREVIHERVSIQKDSLPR